jgi:hypothetical protein
MHASRFPLGPADERTVRDAFRRLTAGTRDRVQADPASRRAAHCRHLRAQRGGPSSWDMSALLPDQVHHHGVKHMSPLMKILVSEDCATCAARQHIHGSAKRSRRESRRSASPLDA